MTALRARAVWCLMLPLVALTTNCNSGSPAEDHSRYPGFNGTAGSCGQLSGIDVSSYNADIDWAAVGNTGIAFAFAKASEGLTVHDAQFPANWAGMKAGGIARGGYHFFHPRDDGTAQADAFLSVVGSFAEGDLPPVLDWETSDESDPAAAIAAAGAFIAEIESRTGRTTIVYTDRAYWNSIGDPEGFAENPLWFASDEMTCPTAPSPWSTWLFWQYSSEGSVAGVTGAVDLDQFAGTLSDLRMFAGVDAGAVVVDAGWVADAGMTTWGPEPPILAGPVLAPKRGRTDGGDDAQANPSSGCQQGNGMAMIGPPWLLLIFLRRLRPRPGAPGRLERPSATANRVQGRAR